MRYRYQKTTEVISDIRITYSEADKLLLAIAEQTKLGSGINFSYQEIAEILNAHSRASIYRYLRPLVFKQFLYTTTEQGVKYYALSQKGKEWLELLNKAEAEINKQETKIQEVREHLRVFESRPQNVYPVESLRK